MGANTSGAGFENHQVVCRVFLSCVIDLQGRIRMVVVGTDGLISPGLISGFMKIHSLNHW